MTVQGTIRAGMVVLEQAVQVPDGTKVSVFIPTATTINQTSDLEHQRRKAALAELLALPNENPGDPFSGEDHEQALYGERE